MRKLFAFFALLAVFLMSAIHVFAQERPTLIGVLEADGRFGTLLAAIDAAGLTETLEGEGPFTLLAPTDDALATALEGMGMTADELLANTDALTEILSYHVIPGRYFFRNLVSGPTLDTALEGTTVTFDLTDGVFTAEGVNILDVDNIASNGVMHVAEGVLLPPEMRAAPEAEATEAATEEAATPEPTAEPTAEATTVAAPTRPTLIGVLEADGRFGTLLAAIDAAGLTETLEGEGPFTLLAPTDDAFTTALEGMGMTADDLLADTDTLTDILLYHVLPGRYLFRTIVRGVPVDTALEGATVTFDLTDGVFTAEGVNILDVDNIASNGVMHVAEGVLLPPDMRSAPEAEATEVATEEAATPEPTVEPTAEPTAEPTPEATTVAAPTRPDLMGVLEGDADGRFTTLVAAIDAAGLRETLTAGGPFTVLAPTNDAFTAALEALGMSADDLLADSSLVNQILLYHVIPGRYFFRNLTSGPTLDTALSGTYVTFNLTDGVFTVEGANLSDPDNIASNGVVHAIDSVILPPDLRPAPEAEVTPEPTPEVTPEPTTVAAPERPNLVALLEGDADGRFTTLLAALGAAGLTDTLSGEGPFTLLAPTNDAIAATLDSLGLGVNDLVGNPDLLTQILTYHVIPGEYFFRNLTSGPTLDTVEGEPVTFNLTDGVFTVEGANLSDPDNIASNGVMHVIDSVILPPSLRATLIGNSHVRAAHLSPSAGEVDVFVNGELSDWTNVAFPTISEWLTVKAASYDVAVAPTGSEETVSTLSVDVGDGQWVTVAVTGADALETALYEDFSPLADGQARLGVFNGVEGSGNYNVVVDGVTLVTLLGYPGTLGGNDGYYTLDLEAGTHSIQIVSTSNPANVILDLGDVALEAGTNTFVAITGTTDAPEQVTAVTAVPAQ